MFIGLLNLKRGFILLLLFLVGCGPVTSTSTPSPKTLEACTPPAGNINIYRNYSVSYDSIYRLAWSLGASPGASTPDATQMAQMQTMILTPGFNSQNLSDARYNAFQTLMEQVQASSNYKDLLFGENFLVRITITFISPRLIESVVLNQVLKSGNFIPDYPAEVKKAEESIARRDETLFLVTVAASKDGAGLTSNDPLTVDIPIKEMVLTDSSALPVEPYHFDSQLEYPIELQFGPEHGYTAYPLGVTVNNGDCHWLADPTWTTALTIHIPGLSINDAPYGPVIWSIDYHPLVEFSPMNQQALPTPPANLYEYSPSDKAPVPAKVMEASPGDWEKMALYVWYHLTNLMPR